MKDLSITAVLSLSSTEAIKQAVAEGLGVAIVSRLALGNELTTRWSPSSRPGIRSPDAAPSPQRNSAY